MTAERAAEINRMIEEKGVAEKASDLFDLLGPQVANLDFNRAEEAVEFPEIVKYAERLGIMPSEMAEWVIRWMWDIVDDDPGVPEE